MSTTPPEAPQGPGPDGTPTDAPPALPALSAPLAPWLDLIITGELSRSCALPPERLSALGTLLLELPAPLRAPLQEALLVVVSNLHPTDSLSLLNLLRRTWRPQAFPLEFLEVFERASAGPVSPLSLNAASEPGPPPPPQAP